MIYFIYIVNMKHDLDTINHKPCAVKIPGKTRELADKLRAQATEITGAHKSLGGIIADVIYEESVRKGIITK